jgi:hypothetical protein
MHTIMSQLASFNVKHTECTAYGVRAFGPEYRWLPYQHPRKTRLSALENVSLKALYGCIPTVKTVGPAVLHMPLDGLPEINPLPNLSSLGP